MSIFIFNNFQLQLFMFSISYFTFLEVRKPGRFFRDSPKQGQLWGLRKISSELVVLQFLIIMTEEHVIFHFQGFCSGIIHVFHVLFDFPEIEKSGIFFWQREIRPTLTSQKKYSNACFRINFLFTWWISMSILFSITFKYYHLRFRYFIQTSWKSKNKEDSSWF